MSNVQAKIGYVFRVRLTTKDDVKIAYVPLEKFYIGSNAGLPVTVKDKSIDGQHLLVTIQDNQIFLTDQKSEQGTWVNGRTISPGAPYPYCPGDRITLGTSEQTLQLHLFVQCYNADLEPARIVKDAQVRGREVREEIIAKAQEEIRQKAEEWTLSSRERMLAVAQQDARALLEKTEQEMRRRMAEFHESLMQQKKQAIADAELVIADAQEEAKEILMNAERKGLTVESVSEQKAARFIAEGREEAEAIIKKGQAAAFEIKTAAHDQAQKLVAGAKQREDALMKSGTETRETEMRNCREEISQLRAKAQSEITELIKQASDKALAVREESRIETEKALSEMQAQVRQGLESAKAEAEGIVSKARQTAIEIERKAQEDAHTRSHEAFQAVVSEAESRALAIIQERDLRSQRTHEQAVRESMSMLDAAREEASRILQEGKMNAVLERSADIARALNEANAAADEIRAQARRDAEQILNNAHQHDVQTRSKLEKEMAVLYQESHKKAEIIVEDGRNQASATLEKAADESRKMELAAHERATAVINEAQRKVAEIEEDAREQALKDSEDQRVRVANELYQMREQTQEAYRLAKVHEAERRAQLENEMFEKRAAMEAEFRVRRATEIGRIDLHWATKRRQDVAILMRNLDLSWSAIRMQSDKDKTIAIIRDIVERSFVEKQEKNIQKTPTWMERIRERSGMIVICAVIAAGAGTYLKRTTIEIPVVSERATQVKIATSQVAKPAAVVQQPSVPTATVATVAANTAHVAPTPAAAVAPASTAPVRGLSSVNSHEDELPAIGEAGDSPEVRQDSIE